MFAKEGSLVLVADAVHRQYRKMPRSATAGWAEACQDLSKSDSVGCPERSMSVSTLLSRFEYAWLRAPYWFLPAQTRLRVVAADTLGVALRRVVDSDLDVSSLDSKHHVDAG